MDISLKATLDRIEEGWLIFELDGGGHIELPATAFAHIPHEGMTFHLRLGVTALEHFDRSKLTKSLINHLIKPGNS